MKIGAGMLAAAGAVGALVSLPGTARADVFCTGVPTEVNTRSDGLVMLYATWRNDWIAICSIDRTRSGVSPTTCTTWAAQLVTAASQGKTIGFYYSGTTNCAAIAAFENSPAPSYIRFFGN